MAGYADTCKIYPHFYVDFIDKNLLRYHIIKKAMTETSKKSSCQGFVSKSKRGFP